MLARLPASGPAADAEAVGSIVRVAVLIVDDSEAFRQAAKAVIESIPGFAVVGEADSGELAVSMAARVRPDLVLMDVNLPGIDGLEATKRVLADQPAVTVVLMSMNQESTFGTRILESGAAAYVHKGDLDRDLLVEVWSADQGPGRY